MPIARLSVLLIAFARIVAPQGGYVMATGTAMGFEDAAAPAADCCVGRCRPALSEAVGAARPPAASHAPGDRDATVVTGSGLPPPRS